MVTTTTSLPRFGIARVAPWTSVNSADCERMSPFALGESGTVTRLVMYLAPPIAALALGAAAWVLVGAVLRPVTNLADEAARLSMSRPGRRLPTPT